MADAVVTFNLNEVSRLAEKLNAFALSASDRVDLLKQLGGVIQTQTRERLTDPQKADPDGNKWKEIAETTQRYYARYFPQADPPLMRLGDMHNSISFALQGDSAVLAGAAIEYAGFIQDGTSRMAARKFIGLSPDNIEEIESVIDIFLQKKTG